MHARTCTHTYTQHTCMYQQTYTCTHPVHINAYSNKQCTYMHKDTGTHICTQGNTLNTHIHADASTCVHTHGTHTCIHTYTEPSQRRKFISVEIFKSNCLKIAHKMETSMDCAVRPLKLISIIFHF